MRWDEEPRQAVPQLAESLESTDFLNWTLKLRPGVMFTDGTPSTPRRWSSTSSGSRTPPTPGPSAPVPRRCITSVEATDPTTVMFTLAKVNPQFGVALAGPIGYIGVADGHREGGQGLRQQAGGRRALHVEGVDPGRPHHHGAQPDLLERAPARTSTRSPTRASRTSSSARTSSTPARPSSLYSVEGGTQIDHFTDKGFQYATVTLNGGSGYMFNVAKPPFDDPQLRVGVASAINLDDLNQAVYQGSANVGRHALRPRIRRSSRDATTPVSLRPGAGQADLRRLRRPRTVRRCRSRTRRSRPAPASCSGSTSRRPSPSSA